MHMDNVLGVVDAVNSVKWVRGQENSERLWGHQCRCPNYADPEEVRACATASHQREVSPRIREEQ